MKEGCGHWLIFSVWDQLFEFQCVCFARISALITMCGLMCVANREHW